MTLASYIRDVVNAAGEALIADTIGIIMGCVDRGRVVVYD